MAKMREVKRTNKNGVTLSLKTGLPKAASAKAAGNTVVISNGVKITMCKPGASPNLLLLNKMREREIIAKVDKDGVLS